MERQTKITVQNGRVKIARWGLRMGHTDQRHDAAPTKKGTWVFFDGFATMEIVGASVNRSVAPKAPRDKEGYIDYESPLYPAYAKRMEEWTKKMPGRWMYGWIDLSDPIYVGWTRHGKLTRNGFFNMGPWNLMTAGEAIEGLHRIVARAAGYAKANGFKMYVDCSNLQVYVPHTTKIH